MKCPECESEMDYDAVSCTNECPECGEEERDDDWHTSWERDSFGDN